MALTIPVAEIVESSKNPLLGKHESWGRVLLGDIATIQNGFPFKSSQFTRDEGMPLIRIRDVGTDGSDTNYVGDYDPAFIVKAGDLLIGMDGDFNCARWRGPEGLLNQRVCRVILKSDIYHPKLLDYALPGYLKAINDMTSSVTVKHLSSKSIAEIPLPLPPMEQQKRIVAEIEKQFSRLDEAVANLKRVKANLKRYKAAVLKAAVEGRLVETEAERARREGHSYETGAQLLQRILETRRSQWKGKGKCKEPAAPDTTALPELPDGWVWASVDQLVAHLTDGDHQAPPQTDQGIPFLVIGNVRSSEIDFSDTRFVGEAYYKSLDPSRQPRLGDLLYTLVGSYGIPVRVRTEKPFCIQRHMAILRPHEHSPMSYLTVAMGSGNVFKQATAVATGTAQLTVPLAGLRRIAISLPPISEQERIVAEVDRRLTLLRATEAQVVANLRRSECLRNSVLARAFSIGLGL